MPRKVKKSDVERWLKLREEGYTYKEMQKTTGWNAETIRKHCEEAIAEKDKAKKDEAEKSKAEKGVDHAKIFAMFDEGKEPIEVVKRGLCTPEQAKKALQDYADLKGKTIGKVETDISDLNDGLDALQERIEKLEESVASDLNSEWQCPECGAKGKVAVRFQCTACKDESWFGYWPKDEDEDEDEED
jgi:hypothetical protein